MNADRLYIRPATGLLVRDPETFQPIPAEGREVARSPFWLRRLRAGDVLEGVALASPAPDPKPKRKE